MCTAASAGASREAAGVADVVHLTEGQVAVVEPGNAVRGGGDITGNLLCEVLYRRRQLLVRAPPGSAQNGTPIHDDRSVHYVTTSGKSSRSGCGRRASGAADD